jgi:cobalt-zinc-cadmium efflux system protein
VFTDLVSLLLSFGAILLAARPVSKERTFGWHRAEVLAALANGVLLFAISGFLIYEAYRRFSDPPEVRVTGLFVVAVAGLLANGLIVTRLRGHAHHDLNLRSAYLHVLADFAGSVGVVIAALIMLASGWYIADPILGLVIALGVLVGSIRLLNETLHILLEGVPPEVDLHEVAEAICEVPGVDDIHDLHIWTICSHLYALSVHATVGDRSSASRDEIITAINDTLRLRFRIIETSIQTEREACRTDELIHLVGHPSEEEPP